MSETTRMAYGQESSSGRTLRNGPLGKGAVSDFAPSCAAQKCHFSNRKRRKVIVQHEALFGFAFEDFEALHVVAGAKSCGHQGLRFAAGEDRRSVSSRQHADLDPDIADLVESAAVGTPFVVDNVLAENAFAQGLEVGLELLLRGFVFRRDGRLQLLLQLANQIVALRLGMFLRVQTVCQVGADAILEIVVISLVKLRRSDRAFRLPCFLLQIVDGGAN